MIKLKRAYEPYDESDGYRILVDRLWPRGVSKAKAKIDEWVKELAPSDSLRKWYAHQPPKWPEFKRRYFEELQNEATLLGTVMDKQAGHTVTFIYAAKDESYNNAVALKEYIDTMASEAIESE